MAKPVPIFPVKRLGVALRIGSLRRHGWSGAMSLTTVWKALSVKACVSIAWDGLEAIPYWVITPAPWLAFFKSINFHSNNINQKKKADSYFRRNVTIITVHEL